MRDKLQAIRGMNDILPSDTSKWQQLEAKLKACLSQYAYEEIRLPLLESTQLFKRSIGEVTDIVEKEMYSFTDLNGESLSLRPEGTAGCIRACLEHGLLHNQQQKLWYLGPMFRHEKPQKGRYRQFYQFGVEALGISGPGIELELIAISRRFWNSLGLSQYLQLEINSLGELEERLAYRAQLIDYLKSHQQQLDEDSLRRLERNPLRILDSKNPAMAELIHAAPKLLDSLTNESRSRFDDFCLGLEALAIPYRINPTLVRGLDYYSHTVFEWTTDRLGSQATVCAGGRFDKLIEQLGGKPSAAVGFAIGIERLLLLLESLAPEDSPSVFTDLILLANNEAALQKALCIAEQLRDAFPSRMIQVNSSLGSFKSQFKRADKVGARFALILAEEELANGTVSIKDLREATEQNSIAEKELIAFLSAVWQ